MGLETFEFLSSIGEGAPLFVEDSLVLPGAGEGETDMSGYDCRLSGGRPGTWRAFHACSQTGLTWRSMF